VLVAGGDNMSDDEFDQCCEWCGSDGWHVSDLQDGKCITCVVNDCKHHNTEEVSYSIRMGQIVFHHVCLDCELCWTYTYKLDNGIRSKLTHEEVNTDDIYQDVKV